MSLFHRRININRDPLPSSILPPVPTCANNIRGPDAVHKKRISYQARGGKSLRVEHDEKKRVGDSPGNRDCTVMSYECHSAGMNTGCLLDALQEAFQIELEKTHRCPVCLVKLWPPTPTTLV